MKMSMQTKFSRTMVLSLETYRQWTLRLRSLVGKADGKVPVGHKIEKTRDGALMELNGKAEKVLKSIVFGACNAH